MVLSKWNLRAQKPLLKMQVPKYVISPQHGKVKAWDKTDWGIEVKVDKELANVKPADYDALVLPGGVMNPIDYVKMRMR